MKSNIFIFLYNLDCTKDLPSFDFGNATADNENTTTVGANATVNCNDGYETTTAKISCPSSGAWLTPTCTLKGYALY